VADRILTVVLTGDAKSALRAFGQVEKSSGGLGGSLAKLGKIATVAFAAMGAAAVGVGGTAIKMAIDFESSFAGIRKTMDLTEAEFGKLAQANRDLAKAIPISVNELNRIGELAGQLGIQGVANVVKFEDTIAKLAVTTDLTADAAALSFAQIANIMQLPQDQIDRLGSTIVGLGNNFATVESQIVEFTQRIAGAGALAGLTAGDVAGISTAFASLGVNAEAGGTAVQKVLLTMLESVATGSDELAIFAKTTGLTTAEFARLWRDDAGAAFAAFVEGLGAQGDAAIVTLDDLGLADQRLIRSFLSAAGAGDLLNRAMEQGNVLWEANTALTEEAEKRFATTASQIQLFKNRLQDVAITLGNALLPVLNAALTALVPFVEKLSRDVVPVLDRITAWWRENEVAIRAAFANIRQALSVFVVSFISGLQAIIPHLVRLASVVAHNKFFLIQAIAAIALAFALALGPAGLIAVAIIAAIAAFGYLKDNWQSIANAVIGIVEKMVNGIIDGLNKAIDRVGDFVEMIGKVPGLGKLMGIDGQVFEGGTLGQITLSRVQETAKATAQASLSTGAMNKELTRFRGLAAGAAVATSNAADASALAGLAATGSAAGSKAAAGGSKAAGEAAKEAGRQLEDLAQKNRALFDVIERIQSDFLNEQIEAFLKGGDEQVAIVKGQQQQMIENARTLAATLQKTFGIELPEALTVAMKHLKESADDVAESARKAAEESKKLFEQTTNLVAGAVTGQNTAGGIASTFGSLLGKPGFNLEFATSLLQRAQSGAATDVALLNNYLRNIGSFATGGVVPGMMGAPQLALVHGGEQVLTPSQRGGGDTYNFSFPNYVGNHQEMADEVRRALTTLRRTGRD
jgi:TP901 family phage tail tape measure protein